MMNIYGSVRKYSMPESTIVKIFDAVTGHFLEETTSDSFGNFTFFDINVGIYRILAIPPNNNFNALIKFFRVLS